VCLGCHNLHLHYKRLLNLPFFVSRDYKNTLFYFKCEIKNKQPFENIYITDIEPGDSISVRECMHEDILESMES
jgi:hypothetical protein